MGLERKTIRTDHCRRRRTRRSTLPTRPQTHGARREGQEGTRCAERPAGARSFTHAPVS